MLIGGAQNGTPSIFEIDYLCILWVKWMKEYQMVLRGFDGILSKKIAILIFKKINKITKIISAQINEFFKMNSLEGPAYRSRNELPKGVTASFQQLVP